MKVFIVGAGFSKAAGYPLGNEMLTRLGEYVEQHRPAVQLQDLWNGFVSWKSSQTDAGVLELIDTGNVEFIITYLDMLEHAQDFNRTKYYKEAKSLEGSGRSKAISERERKLEETGKFFSQAGIARDRLRRLLVQYFEHEHCEDYSVERYRYIKDFCSHMVSGGDFFISFNYDSLVERSLWKLEMWSPQDGYGFECRFKKGEPWDNLTDVDLGHSPVKVLKLHGSVGWYKNERNKIFLNWGVFLQHFISNIRDVDEPETSPAKYEHPFVIEPSFIKPIEQKELLDIWDEARSVLEKAREIFIVGYSMPKADASAQNLIVHSLRANSNLPKVTVVNPDKDTLGRFEELLGFQIEKQRSKVEDWAHSLVTNRENN
jgi:hypothetical protein